MLATLAGYMLGGEGRRNAEMGRSLSLYGTKVRVRALGVVEVEVKRLGFALGLER